MEGNYLTSKICMTKDIGTNNNLFGGIMMAWIDEAAAIHTRRVTGEPFLVTLKYSEILFKHPVKVGDLVEFFACHDIRGNTSLTFDLVGKVNNLEIIKTNCTFVAVDENGKPKRITKFLENR